jgi:oligosaccharyltransferase complex subunit beta
VTIKHVLDNPKLGAYKDFFFDNLVLFNPTSADFGEHITVKDIVNFIDAGNNIIVAGTTDVSEPIREVAESCGVEFATAGTAVVDHVKFDGSDANGPHTLLTVQLDSDNALVRKITAPVLYRGISHTVAVGSKLIEPVLLGSEYSYNGDSEGAPLDASKPLLISAYEARNNARIIFSGSLEFFSNAFISEISAHDTVTAHETSGNRALIYDLSTWCFQERGRLRVREFHHNHAGVDVDTPTPELYRIKDDVTFSVVIEELNSETKQWVPFHSNDVMIDFTMIDPYYRLFLEHDDQGNYAIDFKVPDVFGIYKFVLHYHHAGYSTLHFEEHIIVRPFMHNEFERFIDVAYPYYTASFLSMAAFFVFGVVFMHTKAPAAAAANSAGANKNKKD